MYVWVRNIHFKGLAMLQVFIVSHTASQVAFACCLHKVDRKQKSKKRALTKYLGTQLASCKNQNTRSEIHLVSQECSCSQLNSLAVMGYSRKTFKQGQGGELNEDIRCGGKKNSDFPQIATKLRRVNLLLALNFYPIHISCYSSTGSLNSFCTLS